MSFVTSFSSQTAVASCHQAGKQGRIGVLQGMGQLVGDRSHVPGTGKFAGIEKNYGICSADTCPDLTRYRDAPDRIGKGEQKDLDRPAVRSDRGLEPVLPDGDIMESFGSPLDPIQEIRNPVVVFIPGFDRLRTGNIGGVMNGQPLSDEECLTRGQ